MRSRISIRGCVRPSIRPSVRQSVRPSVGHTRVEKCRFWPKLLSVRARTHLMPCIRPCSSKSSPVQKEKEKKKNKGEEQESNFSPFYQSRSQLRRRKEKLMIKVFSLQLIFPSYWFEESNQCIFFSLKRKVLMNLSTLSVDEMIINDYKSSTRYGVHRAAYNVASIID